MKPFNIPKCRLQSIMHQHAGEEAAVVHRRGPSHLYLTTGALWPEE